MYATMQKSKRSLFMDKERGIARKEIVFPSDPCLFLDLDMTLIDESRRMNDRSIPACVKQLQQRGWSVGLNSNTPLEPLLVWMQYFGMTGSFIAEKGGVFYHQGRAVFDEGLANQIQVSREAIKQRLRSMNVQLLLGNPTDVLREYAFTSMQPGPLVILDTVRKSSVNFYVREVTPKKRLVINFELAKTLVDAVRSLYRDVPNLKEKIDVVNGTLLAMQGGQSKRTGIRAFMMEAKLTQVGMIGDSMNDYLGDLAVHYAVGNATKDFQEKAVFVSKFPMAQGCKDIMKKLVK
jgi:hydroxymethylpyrimidine pyrophosphatase-like HAD family hydrolase